MSDATEHNPDRCGCENHADFCPFNPASEYYRAPKPQSAQFEPPWPRHETAVVSIRYPYHTAHLPTKFCAIEEPHLIADCGEFER